MNRRLYDDIIKYTTTTTTDTEKSEILKRYTDDPQKEYFKEKYVLKQNRLFINKSAREVQLIRDDERAYVLYRLHDKKNHASREKSLADAKQRFFWNGMLNDISKYLSSCSLCNPKDLLNSSTNLKESIESTTQYMNPYLTELNHLAVINPDNTSPITPIKQEPSINTSLNNFDRFKRTQQQLEDEVESTPSRQSMTGSTGGILKKEPIASTPTMSVIDELDHILGKNEDVKQIQKKVKHEHGLSDSSSSLSNSGNNIGVAGSPKKRPHENGSSHTPTQAPQLRSSSATVGPSPRSTPSSSPIMGKTKIEDRGSSRENDMAKSISKSLQAINSAILTLMSVVAESSEGFASFKDALKLIYDAMNEQKQMMLNQECCPCKRLQQEQQNATSNPQTPVLTDIINLPIQPIQQAVQQQQQPQQQQPQPQPQLYQYTPPPPIQSPIQPSIEQFSQPIQQQQPTQQQQPIQQVVQPQTQPQGPLPPQQQPHQQFNIYQNTPPSQQQPIQQAAQQQQPMQQQPPQHSGNQDPRYYHNQSPQSHQQHQTPPPQTHQQPQPPQHEPPRYYQPTQYNRPAEHQYSPPPSHNPERAYQYQENRQTPPPHPLHGQPPPPHQHHDPRDHYPGHHPQHDPRYHYHPGHHPQHGQPPPPPHQQHHDHPRGAYQHQHSYAPPHNQQHPYYNSQHPPPQQHRQSPGPTSPQP